MKKSRALVAGSIGTLALIAGAASPASAAVGDTVTTFTLNGGTLAIAVQPTAALTNGSAGAILVTGSLGAVTVTDTRGNILGWVASAKSSTFVGSTGTNSTAVAYTAGTVTTTGVVTAVGTPAALTTTAVPVVAGTLALGNNTASWNPTLSVTLPPSSLAGLYTGTVNTSVA